MADLSSNFLGIKSPNPFWLASAPPTDKAYNVERAFKAGWGGVVWKTLGEEGPPVVNVNGPRYGAIWGADRRLLGLNNIELITDRDLQTTGEQFVTVEDSMSIVHQSRGRMSPPSEHLLSEVAIICRLARRTLDDTPGIHWEDFEADYDTIRQRISRVVPDFDDFNGRVRKPGGFRLPNPVNEHRFPTPSGKVSPLPS